jgi:hypothetical protein
LILGFGLLSAAFASPSSLSFEAASKLCSSGFTSGMLKLGVDVCGARNAGSASSSRSSRTTIVGDCCVRAQHRSRGGAQYIGRIERGDEKVLVLDNDELR